MRERTPERGRDWDIFEAHGVSCTRIEIEKCDTSEMFLNDDDAAAFVIQTACNPAADDSIREECRTAVRQLVETWDEEDTPTCPRR